MKLELRPTLFGGQIDGVLSTIREGCREHAHTRAGLPECNDCRVIEFWEPKLRIPMGSISTPTGYVEKPRSEIALGLERSSTTAASSRT